MREKDAVLAFIDTETTGLHPDRRPWEIAIIRRGDTEDRMLVHINDVDLSNADPYALTVGGFYERSIMFSDRPGQQERVRPVTERQAASEVWRLTKGTHLVGVNPAFDAECLDKMLRRHSLLPAWHYQLIDVAVMAVGWLSARKARIDLPWRSDGMSRRCGVEPPGEAERHTAMGDALWAMRWYDTLRGERCLT